MRELVRWEPVQAGVGTAWGVCVEGTRDLGPKRQWIIMPQKTLTGGDVGLICAAHNAHISAGPERSIDVASLVNRQLEPIVQVTLGAESAQMGVREARKHTAQLYECIEAAISDALLTRFIRDEVFGGKEGSEGAVGAMLLAFRKFRERFEEPQETENEQ